MIVHLTRDELADQPIGRVIAARGKELQTTATVAEARELFTRTEVTVVPVLDGDRYVGAVTDETVLAAPGDGVTVGELAGELVPVERADRPTRDALDALDRHGARRLVVVAEDGSTYVGIVCLRRDRLRLCVDTRHLDV